MKIWIGLGGAMVFCIFSANLSAGDLANHSVIIRVVCRNSLSCVATKSVNDESRYKIGWQTDFNLKKITVSIPKSQQDCNRDVYTITRTTGVKFFERNSSIQGEILFTLIDAY
jgi:hypothetical protein